MRNVHMQVEDDSPVHISSLVVHAHPDDLPDVRQGIVALGGEISAEDPLGKLVVVVETEDEAGVTGFADALRNLDGVLLANLVFHSIDTPEDEAGESRTPEEERVDNSGLGAEK